MSSRRDGYGDALAVPDFRDLAAIEINAVLAPTIHPASITLQQ